MLNILFFEENYIIKDLIKRFNLENERYYKIYGVRKDDLNNYHEVIDTTNLTAEEVANIIIEKFNIWKNN